jgi:hypothetical protein
MVFASRGEYFPSKIVLRAARARLALDDLKNSAINEIPRGLGAGSFIFLPFPVLA